MDSTKKSNWINNVAVEAMKIILKIMADDIRRGTCVTDQVAELSFMMADSMYARKRRS